MVNKVFTEEPTINEHEVFYFKFKDEYFAGWSRWRVEWNLYWYTNLQWNRMKSKKKNKQAGKQVLADEQYVDDLHKYYFLNIFKVDFY